jgi:hypothetical protein
MLSNFNSQVRKFVPWASNFHKSSVKASLDGKMEDSGFGSDHQKFAREPNFIASLKGVVNSFMNGVLRMS